LAQVALAELGAPSEVRALDGVDLVFAPLAVRKYRSIDR